jgi:hypothetical protein
MIHTFQMSFTAWGAWAADYKAGPKDSEMAILAAFPVLSI